ncbi:MAG: molybdopterin cofactor-binding domain-containing protein, partial [Nevskiales bacterium]
MNSTLIAQRLAGKKPASAAHEYLHRREFLKLTALAGGGLAIAWTTPAAVAAEETVPPAARKPANPGPFVRINADNTVEIVVNRLDFGQGALTALPMLLAEELDVDWGQVTASLAPAGDAYKDPVFGVQMTGGSSAVPNSWMQYREIGAALRTMLVAAAADHWQVPISACTTGGGMVRSGSKTASYASLAAAAANQPVPDRIDLKPSASFKIIGKSKHRIDALAAVSGKKNYGIDTRLPGMKVALLLRAPTFGGQVESFDAERAKAVRGVRDVFQIATDRGGSGVAIVADGYWPAKQARDLLQVKWKSGVGSTVSSDALWASYREAAQNPRSIAVNGDVSASATAQRHLGGEYLFPYLAHAPMETLNATFEIKPDGVTVWAGTQFQTIDQGAIAQTLGLTPAQVTLITVPAGGGFGRRATPTSDYMREGATIAKTWGARQGAQAGPVKVLWSREDDIKGGYYRPAHLHHVDVALDARGQVVAWDHVIVGQSLLKGTPFESMMVKDGVDSTMTEGVAENNYALPLRLRVTHPDV